MRQAVTLILNYFPTRGYFLAALTDLTVLTRLEQATVDFEAQDEAVLAKILVPAGTPDVAVGTPMMVLIESTDDVAAFKDFSAGAPEAPPAAEAAAAPVSNEPAPAPAPATAAVPPVQSAAPGARVAASPLAKLVSGCSRSLMMFSARVCVWCQGERERESFPGFSGRLLLRLFALSCMPQTPCSDQSRDREQRTNFGRRSSRGGLAATAIEVSVRGEKEPATVHK